AWRRDCSTRPLRASTRISARSAVEAPVTMLRVPHMVLCVNKMDLVDYDEAVFKKIENEFSAFATKLEVPDLTVIPISALKGDNVVNRSENMPWFQGPSLLHHLE
ncbi:hypothetical protein ADL26_20690, partial [Thermoactinomyces vulgaris]